jgi:hypothetical protein
MASHCRFFPNTPTRFLQHLLALGMVLGLYLPASQAQEQGHPPLPPGLPVNGKELVQKYKVRPYGKGFPDTIRNRLSIRQIRQAVQQDGDRIVVDFSHLTSTLDGKELNPRKIYGSVVCGPYPFEARETRFSYLRLRRAKPISQGKGVIDAAYFLADKTNSEGWQDRGQLAIRLKLFHEQDGADLDLGVYDTFCLFEANNQKVTLLPSIVEGPLVNRVASDDPTTCIISLVTSQPIKATITLNTGKQFRSPGGSLRHEIPVRGLKPDTTYTYTVTVGKMRTPPHRLRTAPRKGAAGFRFAYGGDSREGPGFGLESHMGCNYLELNRLAALAYRRNCRFLLQGGDLVNGYTTQPEDYRTQFYGWKHAVMGFHAERPVYPAMGNHECLIHNFDDKSAYGITLDRWPYATESSESIFAEELVLPGNGPRPANPHRPSYQENVYSFQYGCVKCIAVNNNYWISYAAKKYGGSPEGYILPDQLAWIKEELAAADRDPTVKYVIVYMQEPMIPNGGHIKDAMWYEGNNTVRAYTWNGKQLIGEKQGIIEVRNNLMRTIHSSPKVAAILGSDEHGYSKVLIDSKVPVGDPSKDDHNKDGWINYHGKALKQDGQAVKREDASSLTDLRYPVWYLVGGGFGAPFYARERTPWNVYWTDQQGDEGKCFYYSSQANIFIFAVTSRKISVTIVNPYGETIDQIENLLAFPRR